MTVYAEPIRRCRNCGEIRSEIGVTWNRNVSTKTDRCPYCEDLNPGTEKTLRFTIRKGLPDPNQSPDREPDRVINRAELYVTTRGEMAAEVERREWADDRER